MDRDSVAQDSIVFAMRYPDHVGVVWKFKARFYDAAAVHLRPEFRTLVAYPLLSDAPAYRPERLDRVECDLYHTEPGRFGEIREFVARHRIKAVVYMGCEPREIDLGFLRSLGVRTINGEDHSYPPNAHQAFGRRLAKWFSRRVLRRNIHDLYIANAHHQRRFLLEFALLPAGRVQTVLYGLDFDHLAPGAAPAPAALGVPAADAYVVSISQARPEKRIEFLIEVAAEVFRLRPDLSLAFVHVGDGERLEAYRKKIAEAGLEHRFILAGGHADVTPFLRAATVFAHAAERESFGLAVAEAMAIGRPVVACSAPGPAEIIQHGETGYLVDSGDRVGFVRTILELLDDPERRERVGRAAAEHVRKTYPLEGQAAKLAHAIRSVASR